MTTYNHVIAGAIVATAVQQPVLALPLALISHFILDAFPHFGYPDHGGYGEALKHRLTYVHLLIEIPAWLFVLYLFRNQSLLVYLAALAALLPDLMWPPRYFFYERKGIEPPSGPITRFHQRIQWCERPWGIILEPLYLVVLAFIFIQLI